MLVIKLRNLHEKVLKFLLEWRKQNPDFKFAVRISDQGKLLSKGYWFEGNENKIALSFWTGIDLKRNVPNISYVLDLEDEDSYTQFSASDSPEKDKLFKTLFSPKYGKLYDRDQLYIRQYPSERDGDYLASLKLFLEEEKPWIDEVIANNIRLFQTKQNTKNRIGFITEKDFDLNLKKITVYRSKFGLDLPPSYCFSRFNAFDYGPIKRLSINRVPNDCQWIFLTGENGTGKTTLLKAITTSLISENFGVLKPDAKIGNYLLTIELNQQKKKRTFIKKAETQRAKYKPKIHSTGLVAIGPSRINNADPGMLRARYYSNKGLYNEPWLPLFKTTGELIDIGSIYTSKIFGPMIRKDNRIRYIIRAISSICDSIVDISFKRSVLYFEVDKEQKLLTNDGVPFKYLASGFKSIVAMISHIMLHLFSQQPEIDDPSELIGIVIIDEIDLHFHPKMQKDLIIKLTEIFPRIQFIVSTHSPIPLLGAPPKSLIFTVKRDSKKGVYVERMDIKVPFENLLPNSLLTSPIFDLNDITSESHNAKDLVRVEDTYDQVLFNNKLKQEIDEFMTSFKENELIKLFKKIK